MGTPDNKPELGDAASEWTQMEIKLLPAISGHLEARLLEQDEEEFSSFRKLLEDSETL